LSENFLKVYLLNIAFYFTLFVLQLSICSRDQISSSNFC